jgi:hypothetical protein
MATDLMKLVQSVLDQKRALDAKERDLIASLNRVLPDMGYRVVPTAPDAAASMGSPGRSRRGGPRRAGTAPKNLVCAQCGRRFSHPLHLGRHTAATHKSTGGGTQNGKTPNGKTTTAKAASRRRRPARRARRAAKPARKTG